MIKLYLLGVLAAAVNASSGTVQLGGMDFYDPLTGVRFQNQQLELLLERPILALALGLCLYFGIVPEKK